MTDRTRMLAMFLDLIPLHASCYVLITYIRHSTELKNKFSACIFESFGISIRSHASVSTHTHDTPDNTSHKHGKANLHDENSKCTKYKKRRVEAILRALESRFQG